MTGLTLKRDVAAGRHKLRDLVVGLHASPALCRVFGGDAACRAALEKVEVAIEETWGYMWVSNDDGTLHVSAEYWRTGDERFLAIDLAHELVHVKQHHEGRDLFDESFAYVDRPTEIEAYVVSVEEARRFGFTDQELFDFLHVEWLTRADHERLCGHLGVPVPAAAPETPDARE